MEMTTRQETEDVKRVRLEYQPDPFYRLLLWRIGKAFVFAIGNPNFLSDLILEFL